MNHIPKINSKENHKLKLVRAVRDGRENSKIFVEGLRLVEELLTTKLTISFAIFCPRLKETPRGITLINSILNKSIETFEVENNIFDSLADTKNSQGIILIAEKPKTGKDLVECSLSKNPLLILLHQVNNPANLGAILRTAEAVGVNGIITTKGTVDVFSNKTNRSAMGANFRLPLWTNVEFPEVILWAKENGIMSVCADIRSEKSYLEIDWKVSSLLVVGSEGHGLSVEEQQSTDESLIIPMANQVESLNVAVACGVILFEAKRQRKL
ncbi:MAG: RNA methyltransferase [Acidobacteriota bacterium]